MASFREFTELYLFSLFLILITSIHTQETQVSTDPSYYYNLCAPSKCGNLSLTYPFTLPTPCHPSPLETTCPNNSLILSNPTSVDPKRVLSVNFTDPSTITLFVASENLFTCGTQLSHRKFLNVASSFKLPSNYTIGTHYNCTAPILPDLIQGLQNASCLGCNGQDPDNVCYYSPRFNTDSPDPNCEIYTIITASDGPQFFNATRVTDLRAYLQSGYEIRTERQGNCRRCEVSGGRCGANPTSGLPVCFCTSSVHSDNCIDGVVEDLSTWLDERGGHKSRSSKVIVAQMPVDISNWVTKVGGGKGSGHSKAIVAAISASAATLLIVVIVATAIMFTRTRNKHIHFNKETISGISPTRYSYSQLKKFTNNFSIKLGEGGFGCVYKGTVQTKGTEITVAVKLLKKTTEIEKQFMNEVGTIGSVHHHNLVSILGYCVDRDTRLLVYEFMDNGSLDNYIYKNKKGSESGSDDRSLSYKQVYSIALETARGILYLHQGCRVKILHLDIKPSNVLVDSNFLAKVADFGLARMIDKDRSHVSLTGVQGTPGYAAPEMWLKNFGPVTEKSDVYSYGMLLLEMVGRRKLFDSELADSSGTYFPEWLYNKIVRDESFSFLKGIGGNEDLGEEEIDHEEEEEVVRRMCLVGLWCIQNLPSNRPSMDRVVQMLEGHVEFGVPPNPFPQNTTSSRESSSSQEPLILQKSR